MVPLTSCVAQGKSLCLSGLLLSIYGVGTTISTTQGGGRCQEAKEHKLRDMSVSTEAVRSWADICSAPLAPRACENSSLYDLKSPRSGTLCHLHEAFGEMLLLSYLYPQPGRVTQQKQ